MQAAEDAFDRKQDLDPGTDISLDRLDHEAAQEHEDRYRSLILNSLDAVLLTSPDGRILAANEAACRMFRCSESSLIEMGRGGVVDGTDPRLAPALEERSRTGRFHGEVRLVRHDGSKFPGEISSVIFRTRSGELCTSTVIRDVTDRNRSQARTEFLARAATMFLNSDSPEGLLGALCDEVLTLLECQICFNYLVDPESGRLKLNVWRGIPAHEAEKIRWLSGATTVCGHVALHGRRLIVEDIRCCGDPRTDLVRSLGAESYGCHPLVAGGEILGTLSFGSTVRSRFSSDDVSFMKAVSDIFALAIRRGRAEAALCDSEMKCRLLLHEANDAVFVHEIHPDGPGKFVEVNERACRMLGYTREELLRLRVGDIDVPEHAAKVPQILESLRSLGRATFETVHRTKEGQRVPVEVSARYLLLQGTPFVLSVARDVTERQRAAEALAHSNAALQALTERLEEVREQERTRIAREIHDMLAQELTRLKIDITWLNRSLSRPLDALKQELLRKRLTAMTELADTAIHTVQRIATELRPVVLDSLGLAAAIEWLAADVQSRTGIQCEVALPSEDLPLGDDVSTGLFRIVQESFTNVIRHAGARRVVIRMTAEGNDLVLTVCDDGCGFDSTKLHDPQSLGLIGMRERARSLQGEVQFMGNAHQGATVRVRVPLRRDSRSEGREIRDGKGPGASRAMPC